MLNKLGGVPGTSSMCIISRIQRYLVQAVRFFDKQSTSEITAAADWRLWDKVFIYCPST